MGWFVIVFLICFFSLGKKNPFKWFSQTRMKNGGDEKV